MNEIRVYHLRRLLRQCFLRLQFEFEIQLHGKVQNNSRTKPCNQDRRNQQQEMTKEFEIN